MESLRNSLAVSVAQSNTTLVAELQKGLSTALLNQALSCRAMAFILFGRVSVGSHAYSYGCVKASHGHMRGACVTRLLTSCQLVLLAVCS